MCSKRGPRAARSAAAEHDVSAREIMEPTDSWIKDWRIGVSPAKEGEAGRELLEIFRRFWQWAELDRKSKSTKQRYSGALHALGGWAVEKAIESNQPTDAHQQLLDATAVGDGPAIYLDREEWQKELDMATLLGSILNLCLEHLVQTYQKGPVPGLQWFCSVRFMFSTGRAHRHIHIKELLPAFENGLNFMR